MFWLELLAILFFFFIVIRPVYMGYLYAHPPRIKFSTFTPASLGVPYSDVMLKAADGATLKGWYIHSRNGAAVILLHSHSSSRLAMIFPAEALVRAGYGVLMFDLRAHGSSGGHTFAPSRTTVSDVLTAVAYLSKRPEINAAGIGIFGLAAGGTLALHAAARTVAIRAVVMDELAPANMADLPPPESLFERWLRRPLQRYTMKAAVWFAKQPPLPNNVDVLSRLAPRPLLFITTGREHVQRIVRHYYQAAQGPKQLWEIPEAVRRRSWLARPDSYELHLIDFYDYALVSTRHPETAVLPPLPAEPVDTAAPAPYVVVRDATISMLWANVIALLAFPLALLMFFVPYRWIWGRGILEHAFVVNSVTIAAILGIFLLSILMHEWLHVVGFVRVGGAPKTAVRYGFSWKGLAPYAHCKAPIRATAYRISVMLPGVLLGIVPGLIGVAAGTWWLVLWAILMVIAAGGDAAVLLAMRSVPGDALVLDHPYKAGCQVVELSQNQALHSEIKNPPSGG